MKSFDFQHCHCELRCLPGRLRIAPKHVHKSSLYWGHVWHLPGRLPSRKWPNLRALLWILYYKWPHKSNRVLHGKKNPFFSLFCLVTCKLSKECFQKMFRIYYYMSREFWTYIINFCYFSMGLFLIKITFKSMPAQNITTKWIRRNFREKSF